MKTPIVAAEISLDVPHWKVGDNMGTGPDDPEGFGIGQIAVVDKGGGKYDVVFYDKNGKDRGSLKLKNR
jgi:hypothetical protein